MFLIRFLSLVFLPLFLLWKIINPPSVYSGIKSAGLGGWFRGFRFRKFFLRFLYTLLVVGIVAPVWIGGIFVGTVTAQRKLNLGEDKIALSGTGSMYPTFPKGKGKTHDEQTSEVAATFEMMRYPRGVKIWGKNIFEYRIKRGDIVSFANDITKKITIEEDGSEIGFVKRVVALPGDTVEIRGGILYLNDEPQKEPYIARARSTFGGEFLNECKKLTIPEDRLFVMGDNRKGSSDSRHEIGLIAYGDVDHVIPWEKQRGRLDGNWHDPSRDLSEEAKIDLDITQYLLLLNEAREKAGVESLKYQSKLEKSARFRGEVMLKYDDLSFEATRSGYPMERAMKDVGYFNVVWGEAPTMGYFEAEELIENQLEFANFKQFLIDSRHEEIGIAQVEGELNGCPVQIIVQHFAGYVPPDYSQEDINSWKKAVERLREIKPSWERLKDYEEYYQKHKSDVDRINQIIDTRIRNISILVARMEANQWLTDEEEKMLNDDEVLYNEQEALANKLNDS